MIYWIFHCWMNYVFASSFWSFLLVCYANHFSPFVFVQFFLRETRFHKRVVLIRKLQSTLEENCACFLHAVVDSFLLVVWIFRVRVSDFKFPLNYFRADIVESSFLNIPQLTFVDQLTKNKIDLNLLLETESTNIVI